jgi:hypothetical protein
MAKPSMSQKSKSMEMEPGEGKKHEMAETAQEELREGTEPDDMPAGKTNRKRSAKGAKNTKAPMDGEGCSCGARKGKASCDGNCGSYSKKMDRNDALTPKEYLAACDLGIQGRSRSYIRARLDTAERLDLKCGNGSISEGEKCHVGAAQKVQPTQYKQGNVEPNKKAAQRLRTAGRVAGAVGALAPLAGLASGSATGMVAGFGAARTAFTTAGALNTYAKAQETGSKAGRDRLKKEAKGQLTKAGGQLISGAVGGLALASTVRRSQRRQKLEKLYRGPSAKRDSVYASGFSPDLDQLAI